MPEDSLADALAPPAQATPSTRTDSLFLVSLYAAELAVLLMALALNKKGERSVTTWIATAPGVAFAIGLLVLLAASVWIGREYVRSSRAAARRLGLVVAMNLITVALIMIPLDIALRVLARATPDAPSIGDTLLLPRSWERARTHNLAIVQKASGDLSYLVYDERLGWTVGRNRHGGDGMYLSSAEGLRARRQGAVLGGPKDKPRVALVGDSYTFAERVTFEDSWGSVLETSSGLNAQILNFGVGGYGVDQAYLRFKKDVLAWNPDVVIFAFPMHDLYRTTTVYPFINWPDWGIPFSKPRLHRRHGALQALNVPTIPPQAMFGMRSISDLPFLEFDTGYLKHHWEWSVTDVSYITRWLFSYFPRRASQPPAASADEVVGLNGAILRAFIQSANESGITPLVVFFPSRPELPRLIRGETTEWHRLRQRLGVPLLDTTPCLIEIGYNDAFVPADPHYSPRGNAAVARCIGRVLRPILENRKPKAAAPPTLRGFPGHRNPALPVLPQQSRRIPSTTG